MDAYLIELLNRMNDTSDQKLEPGHIGSDTISWKALREAEKIEDLRFVPQLIIYINKEKDKKKRQQAYFLLGHLAKNTCNVEALQFLTKEPAKNQTSLFLLRCWTE